MERGKTDTPLNWSLLCIDGAIPCEFKLEADGDSIKFLLGRTIQSAEFWEKIIPCDSVRTTISREHFQIFSDSESFTNLRIKNLSRKGTILNGVVLSEDDASLQAGDMISVGSTTSENGDLQPALQFKVMSVMSSVAREDQAKIEVTPKSPVLLVPASVASPSIVKINLGGLPPPFSLECISARGYSAAKLQQLPRAQLFLEASCTEAKLRVGRSIQPPEFWSNLLPDAALQNVISREHFEVSIEATGLLLRNLSSSGTWHNGKLTQDCAWVKEGDLICVGTLPNDHTPLLGFQLVEVLDDGSVAEAEGDDDEGETTVAL